MPKISHPPAFLFYPDDFSSDGKVEAMTTEEVGAYMLLLCKSWRESPPGSIPSDDVVLARWARLTADRWSVCRTAVLAAFTFGPDSRWHQKRLRREFDKLKSLRRERRKAANHRWNKVVTWSADASALHKQSIPFPSSIPIKEKQEEKTNTVPAAPPIVPISVWFSFVEHRKKIRKPMTPHAGELVRRKLEALKEQGHDPVELLETAIEQGWKTVYAPQEWKGTGDGGKKLTGDSLTKANLAAAGFTAAS